MSPSHRDDTLRLWNLETGQTLRTLEAQTSEIGRVTGLALTSWAPCRIVVVVRRNSDTMGLGSREKDC
jgi:hypothetical protein